MDRVISRRDIAAYGAPIFAISYLVFFVQSYFLKFATDVLLIAPAVVSILFAVAKIWDSVSAPLIGNWSDRTRSRLGRRRPFLFASLPLLALGFAMLWTVPSDIAGVVRIAWLTAGLLIFFTAVDLYAVPHFALGTALSVHPHDRTRIFAVRSASFTVGIFVAFAGIQFVMNAVDQRHTATMFAIATVFAAVCMLLVPPLALREPTQLNNVAGRGLWNALLSVGSTRAGRQLYAVNFIESAGTGAIAAMGPYMGQYIVCRPEVALLPPTAYVLAGLIAIPLWVRLSKSLGKASTWRISMFVAGAAFGAMWSIGKDDIELSVVLLASAGAAMGCGAVLSASLLADVIDIDARRTGERKEGIYSAVNALMGKLGGALAIGVSGPILAATGFVPNVAQSESAQLGIRILSAGFPCVGFLIGIWLFRKFSLDEDTPLLGVPLSKIPAIATP